MGSSGSDDACSAFCRSLVFWIRCSSDALEMRVRHYTANHYGFIDYERDSILREPMRVIRFFSRMIVSRRPWK